MSSKSLLKLEGVTIWSENYIELAKWYEDTFGLKRNLELDMQLDQAIAFDMGFGDQVMLWIGYHSEIMGHAKENVRIMISYTVDSVDEIFEKIKNTNGLGVIAKPQDSPDGNLRVCTLTDPENNIIQLYSNI